MRSPMPLGAALRRSVHDRAALARRTAYPWHAAAALSTHAREVLPEDGNFSTRSVSVTGQRRRRPIYVAATHQHVGKTTTSLALLSGLSKRFDRVGFIKPVGQQHVPVEVPVVGDGDRTETIRVDKDVCLVREHFGLNHCSYRSMSPCLIGSGYTKQFIDGNIRLDQQLDDIVRGFKDIDAASDVVLCEGTGHAGVGSLVGASNAKVASMLGADMILVANGGLGENL